ncbi:MAG: thiopeptide maturation pyridine synthase [Verrucomicrobiota bacterium]
MTEDQPPVWRALRVTYYAEPKDDLVLGTVRPLLRAVRAQVGRAYFIRHWRRGPHLLVPMEAAPAVFDDVVRPAAQVIVGQYLAEFPSRATLMPEHQMLPMFRTLAEMEQETRPVWPPCPDNTLDIEPHDLRAEQVGGTDLAELIADFYAATNDLVFDMLESVRSGQGREALCLGLMLATAHRHGGEPSHLRSGFVSFRSHAEAFLHHCSSPQATRDAFDQRYRSCQAALARLVRDVMESVDQTTGRVPFVAEWVQALRPFWLRSAALAASGALGSGAPAPDRAPDGRGPSPFHRRLFDSAAARSQVLERPEFQRYRLMLNLTYLNLARLGLTAYARYLLCHLAANAVEDALGVNAVEMIEDLEQHAPP